MTEKEIAQFVRDHYSAAGVEVEGVGQRRVRIRMPPEFEDVTDFCGLLQETYGAHVDLVVDDHDKKCVVFEVYAPRKRTRSDTPVCEEREESWLAPVVAVFIGLVAFLVVQTVLHIRVFNTTV
jgi:hypothetical protein